MAGRPTPRKGGATKRTAGSASLEDAALIQSIRNGRTEAYGKLVQKYQDRVFNTCWRICGHLEDARDLTQEAFLKCFEHLPGFRHQCAFYTWIFRVAVNLALSHRRNLKRRDTVSLEEGFDWTYSQAGSLARRVHSPVEHSPSDVASRAELHGRVIRALQALDDDHRAVVVLRDVEGFDYREIAEILEIPAGTVKSRLHRARESVAQALRSTVFPDT